MKKVSTRAAQRIRNFSSQTLTIGLDLGDRSSWYCVLDESGRIVWEQKVATTPKALQAAFGSMPRSRIALETGMHSPWVRGFFRQREKPKLTALLGPISGEK
jgi:transposase